MLRGPRIKVQDELQKERERERDKQKRVRIVEITRMASCRVRNHPILDIYCCIVLTRKSQLSEYGILFLRLPCIFNDHPIIADLLLA